MTDKKITENKEKLKLNLNKEKVEAKKNFIIHHNEHHISIKKGEKIDLEKIPSIFIENLKTEKVI